MDEFTNSKDPIFELVPSFGIIIKKVKTNDVINDKRDEDSLLSKSNLAFNMKNIKIKNNPNKAALDEMRKIIEVDKTIMG